jgi:uncharacterized protein (DUF433 family)
MSEKPAPNVSIEGADLSIRESPGVSGGYPCVGDTRIAVRLIVETFHETGSLERTVAAFPQLTPDQVRAALDYYTAHPSRVDEDIERNAQAWQSLISGRWPAAESGSTPMR